MKLDLAVIVFASVLIVVSLVVGLDIILGKVLLAVGLGFIVLPLWRVVRRSLTAPR